ncbi:MAG: 30S ribosomal protein S9 [Chitinophagaceae bacterium]|jgi:small subunit ribosomal protein S9|nr:MAG: 30S ribosomal protein S9 [Chitinophagaceae bacterium]
MEKQNNTIGRRKEAVARVFISKGSGKITINGKDHKVYFQLQYLQNQVELPLKTIEATENFDIVITVKGGGIKGQAEASRLGIARGLCDINAEWRPALKHAGLLMRDSRVVERKKPGQKKARKNFQFSKR